MLLISWIKIAYKILFIYKDKRKKSKNYVIKNIIHDNGNKMRWKRKVVYCFESSLLLMLNKLENIVNLEIKGANFILVFI